MKKQAMTKQQKSYIDTASQFGCVVCGILEAQWHHLPMARIDNAHVCGFFLCTEHHTGAEFPGQSIHSSRLLFTQKFGTELFLMQKSILRVVAELSKNTVPF